MEQGMLNNGQRQQLEGIAALGRNEDTYLAHVAPDEMIVPAQALRDNPLLKQAIQKSISKYGIDPNQFLVGNGSMDLNPLTGLPEFGFLSKIWKKAKNVVKKVAPIAINFIPGIGPLAKAALTTVAGKASGLSTKQALLGGALSYGGSKLFGGTPAAGAAGNTATATGGNIFSRAGEFLTKGKDGVGLFGNLGKGLGSMKEYAFKGQDGVGLFGNLKKGIGGFFGAGPQVPEGLEIGADGMYVDAAGNTYGYQQLVDMGVMDRSGNIINTPQANLSNSGGFLDTVKNVIRPDQAGQSQLGLIEDMIKGKTSDPVRQGGGFLGGTPGQGGGGNAFSGLMGGLTSPMGLAGLTGLAAYMAAKKEEGGLSETPKVTMDQLGRYQMAQNLGTGGSRADFGLAPAPVALNFAKGDAVEMEDYINKMTNQLVESYKKDKKYRESRLLPASYIMNEEEEASSEAAKRNDPMTGLKPSYHLVKGVIRILTGESGNRIPQRKIDEIKNMVRSSVKEKQMTQMGFNMGGMAELDMREGGESEGPGTGTSDDIPAMLSDGEFVMTAAATRGAGAFDVNKTKSGIELIKGGSASREEGVKNMRELMNIFEAI